MGGVYSSREGCGRYERVSGRYIMCYAIHHAHVTSFVLSLRERALVPRE